VPHTIGVARIGNPVCAVWGPLILVALPVIVRTEFFGAPIMGRGSRSAWVTALLIGSYISALCVVLSLWAGRHNGQGLYAEIADQYYARPGEYLPLPPPCAASVETVVDRCESVTRDNSPGLCREIGCVRPRALWVREVCRGIVTRGVSASSCCAGAGALSS
jgi:hypothetical protein